MWVCSFLILLITNYVVHGCASTSGTTTATTTASSVTTSTTAASATTTTAATGCTGCTAGSININTADPTNPASHNPTVASGALQGGCSTLIISCAPLAGNPQSLLTFQNGLGGPNPGNPSTATLVCNTQGQWIYTNSGISTAITQGFCLG